MDVGEIATFLPSIVTINQQVQGVIQSQCKKHLERILHDIAETQGISFAELNEKYLENLDTSDAVPHTRIKTPINAEQRCCAKTCRGRCTRKRKGGSKFCGSHTHARPYGEITERKAIVIAKRPHGTNDITDQAKADTETPLDKAIIATDTATDTAATAATACDDVATSKTVKITLSRGIKPIVLTSTSTPTSTCPLTYDYSVGECIRPPALCSASGDDDNNDMSDETNSYVDGSNEGDIERPEKLQSTHELDLGDTEMESYDETDESDLDF